MVDQVQHKRIRNAAVVSETCRDTESYFPLKFSKIKIFARVTHISGTPKPLQGI